MNKKFLEEISQEILYVTMLLETVRDACFGAELYNYETVLNIAIEKQQDIQEKIEFML